MRLTLNPFRRPWSKCTVKTYYDLTSKLSKISIYAVLIAWLCKVMNPDSTFAYGKLMVVYVFYSIGSFIISLYLGQRLGEMEEEEKARKKAVIKQGE